MLEATDVVVVLTTGTPLLATGEVAVLICEACAARVVDDRRQLKLILQDVCVAAPSDSSWFTSRARSVAPRTKLQKLKVTLNPLINFHIAGLTTQR